MMTAGSSPSKCIRSSADQRSVPGGQGRRAEGFTFLELLIALAILGTTFTVLLAAHISASRITSEADHLFIATSLAREVLTRTEVEGLPVFDKDSGDFGESFPGYRWERVVSEVPSLPLADLREVRIRVLWPDGPATRSTEIVFYYLKKTS